MSPTAHYEEIQHFRQLWLWALLIISAVPAGLIGVVAVVTDAASGTNVPLWIGVIVGVVVGPLIGLYFVAFRIEARDHALVFQLWPFHLRPRTVPYEDITVITPTEIDPIGEYGGLGIRIQPSFYRWGVRFDGPIGYIVEGTQGVRIERKSGRPLVVTVSDPDGLVQIVKQVGTIDS